VVLRQCGSTDTSRGAELSVPSSRNNCPERQLHLRRNDDGRSPAERGAASVGIALWGQVRCQLPISFRVFPAHGIAVLCALLPSVSACNAPREPSGNDVGGLDAARVEVSSTDAWVDDACAGTDESTRRRARAILICPTTTSSRATNRPQRHPARMVGARSNPAVTSWAHRGASGDAPNPAPIRCK
jgi:hypothetical protein